MSRQHIAKVYRDSRRVKDEVVAMRVGERIEKLRKDAGYDTQGKAAARLTVLVGGNPIDGNKFSLWESDRQTIDRYTLAAISLLHPSDPAGALLWLRGERPTMPRLLVDGGAKTSGAGGVTGDVADAIEAVQRRRARKDAEDQERKKRG
jgi:hypothetical protein